ncbi:MAG: hypothetical protein US76_02930 [Parcubacteria group bacterium GW2011_GWA2_38_13b]|nr:MAG: hypothetical protein US76_02930 [Parcubacteria group bacterium GW2011_GWA2_38_13b]
MEEGYYNVFKSIRDFQQFADLIKNNPAGFTVLLMDFFDNLSADDRKNLLRSLLGEELFLVLT